MCNKNNNYNENSSKNNNIINDCKKQYRKINTVLFDFDGTIMDTNDLILNSWQHTFTTLTGIEGNREEIIATFGETLRYTMEKFFPDTPSEESIEIYRDFQRDIYEETIKPFPGMVEMIKELKNQGYKLGIVTSRLKSSTMIGLKKIGLKDIFDVIVTMEDCSAHKPDPEPALVTLRKLGSIPEQTIMLGDTSFDIGCAKNAGIKAVLVDWSMAISQEQKTGPEGPDYVLKNPKDIFDILY